MVHVGLEGGGGRVLSHYARAFGFPWNRYRPLLAARCQRVENDRRVLQLCCSFANTLVSPTSLCRGDGGVGAGGVSSLLAKFSTTIKAVMG